MNNYEKESDIASKSKHFIRVSIVNYELWELFVYLFEILVKFLVKYSGPNCAPVRNSVTVPNGPSKSTMFSSCSLLIFLHLKFGDLGKHGHDYKPRSKHYSSDQITVFALKQ